MGDRQDRINVYPSRLALTNMKLRLQASKKGASLLKKRADALSIHYRTTSTKVLRSMLELSLCMKRCRMALAGAHFTAGHFEEHLLENIPKHCKTFYAPKFENVAGVKILNFEAHPNAGYSDDNKMVGLARGGDKVAYAREAFEEATKLIAKQAGLRHALKSINSMLDATKKRVNGIENVVIPRLERTIHYIISELDEEEREEYFRRKKVQFQKRKREAQRHLHHTDIDTAIAEKTKQIIRRRSRKKSTTERQKQFSISSIPVATYAASKTNMPSKDPDSGKKDTSKTEEFTSRERENKVKFDIDEAIVEKKEAQVQHEARPVSDDRAASFMDLHSTLQHQLHSAASTASVTSNVDQEEKK